MSMLLKLKQGCAFVKYQAFNMFLCSLFPSGPPERPLSILPAFPLLVNKVT